jgi:hypothetical protein
MGWHTCHTWDLEIKPVFPLVVDYVIAKVVQNSLFNFLIFKMLWDNMFGHKWDLQIKSNPYFHFLIM